MATGGAGARGTFGRSALPLALTLLVHLVLLLCWWQARAPVRHEDPIRAAMSVVLFHSARPAPPDRPAPARHRPPPRTVDRRLLPSAPATQPPAEAPAEALQPAPPTPAADAPAISAADIHARALRDAGSVDRALRGGKSGVPRESDSPMSRMRRMMANAYIDKSHVETMDIYTAPDGEVTYRFRRGDKVRCRISGDQGLGIPGGYTDGARLAGAGSLGGAGKAGFVSCPPNAEWKRQ